MLFQKKPNKHLIKFNNGFSLVELLVVVAILAILAAIAIPLFLNQKNKAKSATLRSDLRNIIPEAEALRPSSGTAFTGGQAALNASIVSSGFRKSSTSNSMYITWNCKFNPADATALASPGNYIVRGYVNNGAGNNLPGALVILYDSATSRWEESPDFPARWWNVNAAVAAATCPEESSWS